METLTVSTGGLNPSNSGGGFPNLARRHRDLLPEAAAVVVAEVTAITDAELIAAGIEVSEIRFPVSMSGEVPTQTLGSLSMWSFQRAWYYWRASGPGLPVEVAEKLHATHGREVRVDGHCMCPSPRDWYKGFGVGSYHVDSPAGLKALADAILSIYDASKDPDATPRTGGKQKEV